MKCFAIPTDFSDTAKHAAHYALNWQQMFPGSKLMLYHAYQTHVYGSDGTPLVTDLAAERQLAITALNNQRNELLTVHPEADITIGAYPGSLTDVTLQVVDAYKPDLIITGINESNGFEQWLIGSSSVNLVKKAICPIMIVPPNADANTIKKIGYATDLENVENSTPVRLLETLCSRHQASLDLVHYGMDYREDQKAIQMDLLADCRPRFHALEGYNFRDVMTRFVEDEEIDLLVVLSRKHGWLANLFRQSHTEDLAFHTTVPVLAIHELLISEPA
jgi:nucleotide-binding universal stress UspA family protein